MRLSGIGYKSLIIAGIMTLFALPAFAGVLPITSGHQEDLYNPISITWNSNDFLDPTCGGTTIPNYWGIEFYGENQPTLVFLDKPFVYGINSAVINLPIGYSAQQLQITTNDHPTSFCDADIPSCSDSFYTGACQVFPYFQDEPNSFIIRSASFATPTSTAGNLLAAIGDQLADPGFLGWGVLAAGIILGFWVLEKFLDLIPKDREK
jgi:hypothetical protein